jgi:hypothetical protein
MSDRRPEIARVLDRYLREEARLRNERRAGRGSRSSTSRRASRKRLRLAMADYVRRQDLGEFEF